MQSDSRNLGQPLEAHRLDATALAAYLETFIPEFASGYTVQQFRGGAYRLFAESGVDVMSSSGR